MTIGNQLLDQLFKDYKKPEDVWIQNGIFGQLQKALMERILEDLSGGAPLSGWRLARKVAGRAKRYIVYTRLRGGYIKQAPRENNPDPSGQKVLTMRTTY